MSNTARTLCLETLLNDDEMTGFERLAKLLGIPKSTLNRSLINREVQMHGNSPPAPKESRGCRGVGRQASRGSARLGQRRQV